MIFRALMLSCLMVAPAVAQVQVVPQTGPLTPRVELYAVLEEPTDVRSLITGEQISITIAQAIGVVVEQALGSYVLPAGSRVLYLWGPSITPGQFVPYRVSVYFDGKHQVTAGLRDNGTYVAALPPYTGEVPDTEGRTSRPLFDYSVLLQP